MKYFYDIGIVAEDGREFNPHLFPMACLPRPHFELSQT